MFAFSHKTRGDTLIEVLFAISIFSLVAVGGLSIMNQGTSTTQRALEITLVRNEIDAQAEVLRYLNASYIAEYETGLASYTGAAAQWYDITDNQHITGSVFASTNKSICEKPSSAFNPFILDTVKAEIKKSPAYFADASTHSQVRYSDSGVFESAEGIWIQAVKSVLATGNESATGYIDFHINACWNSIGQTIPMTIGTIVRLYEPRP